MDTEAAGFGIVVSATPQGLALEFGESGRGRTLARVYLGSRDAATLATPAGFDTGSHSILSVVVRRAGFLRTASGVVLAVAETAQEAADPRAAIAVRVRAGFRGGVRFYRYAPGSPCPHRGGVVR